MEGPLTRIRPHVRMGAFAFEINKANNLKRKDEMMTEVKLFLGSWFSHQTQSGVYVGFFDNGGRKSEPMSGVESDVTSPRLRLIGIAVCLERLKQPHKVCLITDPEDTYILSCVNGWIADWSENGWRKKSGEPIANQPDIERLARLLRFHSVTATAPHGKEECDAYDTCLKMARTLVYQRENENHRPPYSKRPSPPNDLSLPPWR